MSNIATGIGLSGQLEVDNSGQLNRLAAEKAAAQERQAQQAAKDKQRADFEKEVRKNLLIKPTLTMPHNQREHANYMTRVITDIMEGSASGEMTPAEMAGSVQKAYSYTGALEQADADFVKAIEKVRANPEMYNVEEANDYLSDLKDPYYTDTKEGRKELKEKYYGTEFQFYENDPMMVEKGLPPVTFGYNPMTVADPLEDAMKVADEMDIWTQFDPYGSPVRIAGTNNVVQPFAYKSTDEGIAAVKLKSFQTAPVLKKYEDRLWKKAKSEADAKGENLTKREFSKTDWMGDASELWDAEVGSALKSKLSGKTARTGTVPTPKDEKPSNSGAKYSSKKAEIFLSDDDVIKSQERAPWEANSETGKKYQYLSVAPIQNVSSSLTMNIDIKAGTLYWDKDKKTLRTPKNYESTEKVIPHEMVVMSDGQKNQAYIRFLLAVPADGEKKDDDAFAQEESSEDKFKTRSMESFYIPATRENLNRLSTRTEIPINDWLELKGELETRASKGREAASSGDSGNINQGGGAEMITVEINGKSGQIPSDKIEAFKKKYPNAIIK